MPTRVDDRGSATQRGYGSAWQKIRAVVLTEEPLCRACKRMPATDVDHIIPKRHGGTDDRANLQPLCAQCHHVKTDAERGGQSATRFVVCGPSGAGKSTYCDKHAGPNDPVFDFDRVAAVVAKAGGRYPHDATVAKLVNAMRRAFIEELAKLPSAVRAFIIATSPSEAESIARRVGGRVVMLTRREE